MDKLEYSDRGYCVVKGLLSSDNMDEFEAGFARVMALQAYKIFGDLQLNRIVQSGTDDDFEAAVERLFTEATRHSMRLPLFMNDLFLRINFLHPRE